MLMCFQGWVDGSVVKRVCCLSLKIRVQIHRTRVKKEKSDIYLCALVLQHCGQTREDYEGLFASIIPSGSGRGTVSRK